MLTVGRWRVSRVNEFSAFSVKYGGAEESPSENETQQSFSGYRRLNAIGALARLTKQRHTAAEAISAQDVGSGTSTA
jgi:hypothetical protein